MKKFLSVFLLAGLVLSTATRARADISCLDYYQSYLASSQSSSSTPAPTGVIIVEHHEYYGHHYYHDHYRDWHRGGGWDYDHHEGPHHEGGNSSGDDAAVLAAMLITTGGLITTTIVQEERLKDAQNVVDLLIEARNGDGVELSKFTGMVSEDSKKSVTQWEVANSLLAESARLSFCRGGDLMSEADLAHFIGQQL